MSEAVSCPACSRQLRLPREVIGSEVRCPMCQTSFFTRATTTGYAEAVPSPDAVRPLRPRTEEDPHPVIEPRPRNGESPPQPEGATRSGRIAWLLLATAVGIPLLAVVFGGAIGGVVGGILWSVLALVVMGLGAVGKITRLGRRRLSGVEARAAWAVAVLVVGYMILGCGFWFDSHSVPPGDWQAFQPAEGGFGVEMPGEPAAATWANSRTARIYRVGHRRSRLTFEAGEFEVHPHDRAGSLGERIDQGLKAVQQQHPARHGESIRQLDVTGSWPEWSARRHAYRTNDGRYVIVRLEARKVEQGQRLFVLVVTAPHEIAVGMEDVRRFFSSASMEVRKEKPRSRAREP